MRFSPRRLACIALFAVAFACTEPATQPEAPSLGKAGVDCLPGCQDEEDPDVVNYPGIFLTTAVTATACQSTSLSNDVDGDGLVDRCERDLAAAFAPQLYYYRYDEVGREPKWVAKWLKPGYVRIGYLLSYYRDAGSVQLGCGASCGGHHGDSESIFLDVAYTSSTGHWVLKTAHYSSHETTLSYDAINGRTDTHGTFRLEYPDKFQGYPRAWVSISKHANYATRADCEWGNFGLDYCDRNDTPARVAAGGILNIGSRLHHSAAQDSTRSVNPSYIYYNKTPIRYEAYWTKKDFAGWVPNTVSGARSSPYSTKLTQFGF